MSCTGISWQICRAQEVTSAPSRSLRRCSSAALAERDLEARKVGQERVGDAGDGEGVFDDGAAVAREAILVFG